MCAIDRSHTANRVTESGTDVYGAQKLKREIQRRTGDGMGTEVDWYIAGDCIESGSMNDSREF